MNYEKIYNDLCNRGKTRKKSDLMYVERHHIIPTFFFIKNRKNHRYHDGYLPGDFNSKSNITFLTPREHFIAHLLLCKIWSNTKWFHRCRSSLIMFFNDKEQTDHKRKSYFNPGFSKKYDFYREQAIKSISEERKGKMPVKDIETGEIIGSVSVLHPNVISGKWAHHSKGKKVSEETRIANSKASLGFKNANSKFSNDEIVESYYECCLRYETLVSLSFWNEYATKHDKPFLKFIKSFRFDNRGKDGLIEEVKNKAKTNNVELKTFEDYKCHEWRSFATEAKKQWQ